MTLDQLRVFVTVAEQLHVTRAAAALNMTQSAASAAIQALEARLRTRLFDRVGRGIELTAAGKVLLPEAKAILVQVDRAERALAEMETLDRGRLAVAASQTIAGYWLPRHIARFRARHPGVAVTLAVGNTAEVARAVVAGDADLGFVEGDVEDPLLVGAAVATDELVPVVAAAHPWARRVGLGMDDLQKLDWVLRERGSGTRQVFEDAVRASGGDPAALPVVLELPSNEAVRSAVEAGAGATVISRLVVEAALAAGTLVILPLAFPPRSFAVIRHADRNRSRAETVFLEMIAER